MPEITLNQYNTVGIAIVLLLIGKFLRRRVKFLERYSIPSPVIGGLLFAIIALILREANVVAFKYDSSLKSFFMILFFTTIGFNASISTLKKGGIRVFLFLGVASVLCILQNVLPLMLAGPVGMPKALALMTGSTPMTGGHGTSGAIGPQVVKFGEAIGRNYSSANSIALISATFGLLAGSIIGGPLATGIIRKYNLKANPADQKMDVNIDETVVDTGANIDADKLANMMFYILIAMGIGNYLTQWINVGIAQFTSIAKMPGYIGPMFMGIFMRNGLENTKFKISVPEVRILGDIGLSVFLAVALMTLKLWDLKEVLGPVSILLIAQVILMWIYARYITFNVMGKDYDAAVLAGGHCGFGLGATPNGVANMESVCENFGYSKLAFFVLPIVGGFFIDFVNITIINIFLTMT